MLAPLAGTTILEAVGEASALGLRLAAGLTGRIAADLGAEVIKLEPPGGDSLRRLPPLLGTTGALFAFLNAGKRSVVLSSDEAVGRLASRCDGLLADSAGPAATSRVTALFSMLGTQTPPGTPATEFTVMALGGLLNMIGEPDREPLRLGGHQAAYAAGLAGFTGLVAALCAGDGVAETVRVSMLECVIWLNWKNLASAATSGVAPGRLGDLAEWQVVRCADGFVALVYQDGDWPLFCRVVDDPRLADPALAERGARLARAREIGEIVESRFAALTRAQLREMALARRLPLGPVWSPEDIARDPHTLARDFLALVRLPDGRTVPMPRLPVRWNGAGFQPGDVPALRSAS